MKSISPLLELGGCLWLPRRMEMSLPPHLPCPTQTQGNLKFRNGYRAQSSLQETLSSSDMRSRKARNRGEVSQFSFFSPSLFSPFSCTWAAVICSTQNSQKGSFLSNQRSSGFQDLGANPSTGVCFCPLSFCCRALDNTFTGHCRKAG